MARYRVQGEGYFDGGKMHKHGDEVDLPDEGMNSVPPAGWIDLATDLEVSAEEHRELADAMHEDLKAAAKKLAAEKKAAREKARAEAESKAKAKASKDKSPS